MDERALGTSGLRISPIGLGTLTWGRDTDDHDAREQLEVFLEAGGSFIDTAATYGNGAAEELLGSFMRNGFSRDDFVIATKAGVRHTAQGSTIDASRGSILNSLNSSLSRLRTDYVDLLLVQSPDKHTSVEETVNALELAVTSGKARYVGLANYPGWRVAQVAALLSSSVGLAATQIEFSLVNRREEQDVVTPATHTGVGVIGWSGLGRGVLTGKYRRGTPADSRAASRHLAGFVEPYLHSESRTIVEAVATAADGLDRESAEVALAWARDHAGVACSVIGARTAQQLRSSLGAIDLQLPDEIRNALDEISNPTKAH